MKQSLRLGTISGIPVGLNWGLLLIAGLYLSSLATGFLPSAAPGFSTVSYWLVAAGGVGLFFASILAHELGHSLVAQSEGIRVRAITLWLLGGVAELEKEADNPGAEFRIAAAGPAVSLMLGLLFGGSALAYNAVFGSSLIVTMLAWLGIVNAILAAFNLIPASPLDGGRILTAVLWHRSCNPNSARARSAKVGQVFGTLLLGFGAYPFFGGGGFWLLIIGWFLLSGATGERRRAELFEAATHASVAEVMTPLASPTDSAVTIAGLLAMSGPTPPCGVPRPRARWRHRRHRAHRGTRWNQPWPTRSNPCAGPDDRLGRIRQRSHQRTTQPCRGADASHQRRPCPCLRRRWSPGRLCGACPVDRCSVTGPCLI